MFSRWRRRISAIGRPSEAADSAIDTRKSSVPESASGPRILLQRHDADPRGAEILGALARRYELTSLGEDNLRFEIVVNDARYPDEAVVRLASLMDEIDEDWTLHIDWPRVQP